MYKWCPSPQITNISVLREEALLCSTHRRLLFAPQTVSTLIFRIFQSRFSFRLIAYNVCSPLVALVSKNSKFQSSNRLLLAFLGKRQSVLYKRGPGNKHKVTEVFMAEYCVSWVNDCALCISSQVACRRLLYYKIIMKYFKKLVMINQLNWLKFNMHNKLHAL